MVWKGYYGGAVKGESPFGFHPLWKGGLQGTVQASAPLCKGGWPRKRTGGLPYKSSDLYVALHLHSSYLSARDSRSARARGSGGTSMFPALRASNGTGTIAHRRCPLDSLPPSPTREIPGPPPPNRTQFFPCPPANAEGLREKSLLRRVTGWRPKAAFEKT